MKTSAIPYEQWAIDYLNRVTTTVECHSYETPDEVEMIESYIEAA